MISNLARWLVRRHFYKVADWVLTAASFMTGKGSRIKYHKEGYWSHRQKGWTINESFPNIRLDVRALQQFNDSVYFHQYKPVPGDTVIDLGAGIGTETIFLSGALGKAGKLFAIEASPSTYGILQANIRDNGLENVLSYNIAMADRHGLLKINADSENHIANTILDDRGSEVEAFTMDEFFSGQGIETVHFLKVNIEGAEKLIIRAFRNISKVQHVAISCHDFLGRRTGNPVFFTKEAVTGFLLQNQFEISSRNSGIDYQDDWIYGKNKLFDERK
jgi:FkbM family methyltransferase